MYIPESQNWLASALAEDLCGVSPMTKKRPSERPVERLGEVTAPVATPWTRPWLSQCQVFSTIIYTDEQFCLHHVRCQDLAQGGEANPSSAQGTPYQKTKSLRIRSTIFFLGPLHVLIYFYFLLLHFTLFFR